MYFKIDRRWQVLCYFNSVFVRSPFLWQLNLANGPDKTKLSWTKRKFSRLRKYQRKINGNRQSMSQVMWGILGLKYQLISRAWGGISHPDQQPTTTFTCIGSFIYAMYFNRLHFFEVSSSTYISLPSYHLYHKNFVYKLKNKIIQSMVKLLLLHFSRKLQWLKPSKVWIELSPSDLISSSLILRTKLRTVDCLGNSEQRSQSNIN